jgi:hypothetical protein
MKIVNQTLMVSFETEVKLGNNDAIELTLEHQAFISKGKNDKIYVDLDLGIDISNVKFLGIKIGESLTEYREFKDTISKLGIDIDKLIDEKQEELIKDGIEDKLKLMFFDKI